MMPPADMQKLPLSDIGDTLLRTSLIPLMLMLAAPPAVQFVWVVCYHYSGSVLLALSSPPATLLANFPSSSREGAALACGFLAVQLLLLLAVPGKSFYAIPTPMGNRPRYVLNGVSCFLLTHALLGGLWWMQLVRLGVVYERFGEMLAFLGRAAVLVTVALYLRGIYGPTNSDSGRTGFGVVWDLWHGTELHPEVWGVSLKQLVNCRFAMMGWSVAVVAFMAKQKEELGYVSSSMAVSTFLQIVYIFKFFWWEGGYFNSVDIIHDRFGFYIFWGCSAFLPSIYTLTSYYLVTHPVQWSPPSALFLTLLGVAAVACNYWTDRQREVFRATNGKQDIWGEAPRMIQATYTTGDGKTRHSVLLASGWWGVARHMNYVFEVALAWCWSLPAGRGGVIPYVYVMFLTVLLMDRAYRDEIRCRQKYGEAYEEYCRIVPWKMIPGVY